MNINRIVTALLILELLFAGMLFTSAVSRAVTLDDLGISRPDSLDINTIREEAGLDGDQYAQCTDSLLDMFNGNLNERMRNAARNALDEMKNSFMQELQDCLIKNFAHTVTKFGWRLFGGVVSCVKVSTSDAKVELKNQLRERLQSNFIAGCTTSAGNAAVTDTVTAMLHSQGPDGGPAYVRDYNEWLQIRPEKMAQRRMWALLANYGAQARNPACQQLADAVLDAANVPQSYRDNPPPLGATGLAVNGGTPPLLQWQCTIPDDYNFDATTDAEYEANGGIDGLMAATSGANSPTQLIAMIQSEYQKQVAAMRENAAAMANGGSGGFLPVMSECQDDPESGACIAYGSIKQVPGSTRDIVDSDIDAARDEWNNATGEQGAMNDVASRIRVRLLDLANAPLPLEYEEGPQQQPENYTPEPTPTPAPGSSPTPDPNSPACLTQNPQCTQCPSQSFSDFPRQIVAPIIAETRQTDPGFFINGTNEISAAVDRRLVLQAVCNRMQGGVCHPHVSEDDQIVFDMGGMQVAVRIITSDNFIRIDGGSIVMVCTDGSL